MFGTDPDREGLLVLEALLTVIALTRLAEGLVVGTIAYRQRRWVLIVWGAVVTLLSVPVAAFYLTASEVPATTATLLAGGHAITGACVVAATLSSAGVIRRQNDLLHRLGEGPAETGWRP